MLPQKRWWTIMGLLLLLVGCERGALQPAPTVTPKPDPQTVALQAAQKLLEAELGTSLVGIGVAYGPAEWPDEGLGCPAEGEVYPAQVIPGFQFEMTVDGVTFELHTNLDGSKVVLCPLASPMPEIVEKESDPQGVALTGARAFLAQQLGVVLDDIPAEPQVVEQMAWPDSSLGCPRIGEEPISGEVAGFRFQFLVQDSEFDVRSSMDGALLVLCMPEDERPLVQIPGSLEVPLQRAKIVLGGELGIESQDLAVEGFAWEEVTFPSSALGCPEPDTAYLDVLTDGYQFVLTVGGQDYEVHTDSAGTVGTLCSGGGNGDQGGDVVAEDPGTMIFTSYSNEDLGFGISFPLGWTTQVDEGGGEIVFESISLAGGVGMAVAYLGDREDGPADWLSEYQIELYSEDPSALGSGEPAPLAGSAISQLYQGEREGVERTWQVSFFEQGYRVIQWAPAEEWSNWADGFIQMLDSLVEIRPAGE